MEQPETRYCVKLLDDLHVAAVFPDNRIAWARTVEDAGTWRNSCDATDIAAKVSGLCGAPAEVVSVPPTAESGAMSAPHRATEKEWAQIERWVALRQSSSDSCLLELRSRVAALEAAQPPLTIRGPYTPADPTAHKLELTGVGKSAKPAPDESLINRLAYQAADFARQVKCGDDCRPFARKFLRTVADWFEAEMGRWAHAKTVAAMLREEADHG